MPQAKTLTVNQLSVIPVSQDKNGVWTLREAVASTKSIAQAKTITSSCIRKPKSGKHVVTHKFVMPHTVDTLVQNKKANVICRATVTLEFDERTPLQEIRSDIAFINAYLADPTIAKMANDLENLQ